MELREVHTALCDLHREIERGDVDVKVGLLRLINYLCRSGLLGDTDSPEEIAYQRWWNS